MSSTAQSTGPAAILEAQGSGVKSEETKDRLEWGKGVGGVEVLGGGGAAPEDKDTQSRAEARPDRTSWPHPRVPQITRVL